MKLTDPFIRRPVLALVVNLVIIIAGLQAIRSLNVRQYPRSDNAVVTVTTVYVGASADLVRGFVTIPLERAIAAADGIDYIQSQSALGLSTISARLKLNYDPIKALSEISSKVDQVRNDLPPEAEVPTINVESADSQFASAYLSFTSDVLQQNEITDYLVRIVQPRLSAIQGVQRADVLGARTFAMRVWLKPERMAAFNVSPVQVRQALAANNFLAAVGRTKGALIQVNLTANTDLRSVEEFKRLVVRQQDGAVIRLEDIGDVVLGAEDYDTEVRFSGQTAVFMGIWPLPNANSVDVIRLVSKEMDAIGRQLPEGLDARVAYDATNYISNAIREVVKTLSETLLIVVFIIFMFLGSLRSVLVPVVAIPLSLIGAVFLMQVLGFTINLLTLLAIVLSVGLVVDDAIVVVENVERHLSEGKSPIDAALLGARELVGPLIAMTVTLAAVYAPIGLQGGLTGSLFREFAFTLAGAVDHLRYRGPDPVAHDVVQIAGPGNVRARLCRQDIPGFQTLHRFLRASSRWHAECPAGGLYGLDRGQPADHSHVPHVAQGAGPARGPGRHFRYHRCGGQLDPRPEQPLCSGGQRCLHELPGNEIHLPDHPPQFGYCRHGGQALG